MYLVYVWLCTYVCGHRDVNSTSFLLPCDWPFHSTCCGILSESFRLLLHHELWGLPSVCLLYHTRHMCLISYVRSFRLSSVFLLLCARQRRTLGAESLANSREFPVAESPEAGALAQGHVNGPGSPHGPREASSSWSGEALGPYSPRRPRSPRTPPVLLGRFGIPESSALLGKFLHLQSKDNRTWTNPHPPGAVPGLWAGGLVTQSRAGPRHTPPHLPCECSVALITAALVVNTAQPFTVYRPLPRAPCGITLTMT